MSPGWGLGGFCPGAEVPSPPSGQMQTQAWPEQRPPEASGISAELSWVGL